MNSKTRIATLVALLVLAAIFAPTVLAESNKGNNKDILTKIQNIPGIKLDNTLPMRNINSEIGTINRYMQMYSRQMNINHYSFKMYNGYSALPTSIDIWVDTQSQGEPKIDYLLPGSGLTPNANFNTNPNKTLIQQRMDEGYSIVVGITPPEGAYDPKNPAHSPTMLSELGIPAHIKDAKKVIKLFQRYGLDYDYMLEGHSAGAMVAAITAVEIGGNESHLKNLTINDMALEYKAGTAQAQYAALSYSAVTELYNRGTYLYSSFEDQKALADIMRAYPGVYIDSGVPRGAAPGNFSVEGLFYFASIRTGWMPGPVTEVTGLPDSWIFGDGGYLAGNYEFAADPAEDSYNFSFTEKETLFAALDKINYGAYPTAFERDIMATLSGANPIDWNKIPDSVHIEWNNVGKGVGNVSGVDQAHEIMCQRPGSVCETNEEFAHADLVFANNAFE